MRALCIMLKALLNGCIWWPAGFPCSGLEKAIELSKSERPSRALPFAYLRFHQLA